MSQNPRQTKPTKRPKKTPRGQRRVHNIENSGQNIAVKSALKIKEFHPLTDNQALVFDAYDDGRHLFLHGYAGTGKSFLALYLSLQEILDGDSEYNKVIIIRSTVSSRDQGFLPGKPAEKAEMYELPYHQICNELFGRGDAYIVLKNKGLIQFESTSFLRGLTLSNAIVIFDEAQNASAGELNTAMTRIGHDSKMIFCGDIRQNDLVNSKSKEKSGVSDFMKVIKRLNLFTFIEFGIPDIVRSNLVRDYIIARAELEDANVINTLLG